VATKKRLIKILALAVIVCTLLVACGENLAGCMAVGIFMLLPGADPLTPEQIETLIAIRDAVRDKVETAYWLMDAWAAQSSNTATYHDRAPEAWNREAYDLMAEADAIARTICHDGRAETAFGFIKMLNAPWRMLLEIDMDTDYRSVNIIYCPFPTVMGDAFPTLGDDLNWFYVLQDYV
jgi:hypothetical protein